MIMKDNKQNEELQTRREFLKEAAKKALPVIGAIALAGSPILAQAANSKVDYECSCTGCTGGCSYTCQYTCKGACMNGCKGGCKETCVHGCKGTCQHYCTHGTK